MSPVMNKRLLLVLVLGVALGAASVYGQFGNAPAKLTITKVRDDLFVIRNEFVPGNSTALITNEGVVLVDGLDVARFLDAFESEAERLGAE